MIWEKEDPPSTDHMGIVVMDAGRAKGGHVWVQNCWPGCVRNMPAADYLLALLAMSMSADEDGVNSSIGRPARNQQKLILNVSDVDEQCLESSETKEKVGMTE